MDQLPDEIVLHIMSFLCDDYYELWSWARTNIRYYGLSLTTLGNTIPKDCTWLDLVLKRYIPYRIYKPSIGPVIGTSFNTYSNNYNTRYIVTEVSPNNKKVHFRAIRWEGPLVTVKGNNKYSIDIRNSVSYLPTIPKEDKSIIPVITDDDDPLLHNELYLTKGGQLAVKGDKTRYKKMEWITEADTISIGDKFFSNKQPIPVSFSDEAEDIQINNINNCLLSNGQIITYNYIYGIVENIQGKGKNCIVEAIFLSSIKLRERVWQEENQYFLHPYGPYHDKPRLRLKCTGVSWKVIDQNNKSNNKNVYKHLCIVSHTIMNKSIFYS